MNKEWTFMIYMAGDNNLSEDMISAIDAIKTGVLNAVRPGGTPTAMAGKWNNVAFLVEYNGSHPCVDTYRYDLTFDPASNYDPQRHPIHIPDEKAETEEEIGEFIKWGMQKRPADNYALIISGHSDGFGGRTLLLDDTAQSVGSIKTLAVRIGDAMGMNQDNPPKTKLDLLCFDSCVMSSMEVMYEFKDCADHWIASQGSIPNYTWNYQGIAEKLVKLTAGEMTDYKVFEVILDQIKRYNDIYAFQGRSVDVSAADLTKIDVVAERLEAFIHALVNISILPNYPVWIRDYWSRMLTDAHVSTQTFMCEQSVDLRDYSRRISNRCKMAQREIGAISDDPPPIVVQFLSELASLRIVINALIDAINSMVRNHKRHSGGDYRYAKGVSIFRPWSFIAFWMSRKRYFDLKFISETRPGFLWFQYILVQVLREARPPVDLVWPPFLTDPKHRKIPDDAGESHSSDASQSTEEIGILKTLDNILAEHGFSGGVRDNPPHSKGMDAYLDYFRTIKNFWPPLVK